jgi:hypothetical protein
MLNCSYPPTDVFASVPPGMCLGQLVYFPAQGVDKTSAVPLPPDIGEPGVYAILGYNDSGATIAQGKLIARKAATVRFHVKICPSGSDPSLVAGVALGATTDTLRYGFFAVPGLGSQCKIEAGAAGITADTRVKVGVADGVAVDSASTDACAFAHETAASGAFARCTLLLK